VAFFICRISDRLPIQRYSLHGAQETTVNWSRTA
jgi:hypothetical protein